MIPFLGWSTPAAGAGAAARGQLSGSFNALCAVKLSSMIQVLWEAGMKGPIS